MKRLLAWLWGLFDSGEPTGATPTCVVSYTAADLIPSKAQSLDKTLALVGELEQAAQKWEADMRKVPLSVLQDAVEVIRSSTFLLTSPIQSTYVKARKAEKLYELADILHRYTV